MSLTKNLENKAPAPVRSRLLINAQEVCQLLGGISRALLSKWSNDPSMNFPKRANFGGHGRGRVNLWVEQEVIEWALTYHRDHAGQYVRNYS